MASVIRHRAWDTVGLQFVYWKAPFYDPTGLFWVGPPAFGDLTEVTILTLTDDGVGINTYGTLQDVIDAITLFEITDGDLWRIEWTGDAYIPDGEAIGTVIAGRPSWEAVIPWTALGLSATTLTATGGGSVTSDAEGRPVLSVTSATSVAEVLLGTQLRTPRRYHLATLFNTDAPANNNSICAALLRRVSTPADQAWTFTQYQGGLWVGGAYWQATGSAFSSSAFANTPNLATLFDSPASMDLIVALVHDRLLSDNIPFVARLESAAGGLAQAPLLTLAGGGGWTSSETWEPVARLQSAGAASQMIVTGLALNAAA